MAETIRAEGWKWVEAAISFPYGHTSGMRRIYGERQELTAEEIERHATLKAEYDKLDAEYAEAEDYDEEVENRLEELGGQLDAFTERPEVYDPGQMTCAGVFVTLAANGQIQIERGFVRSEDEPRGEPGDTGDHADSEPECNDGNGNGVVVNGKPVDGASEDDDEADDGGVKPLPDRLVYDLTAQRTLALRNAIAGDADVAFVAALHAFVLQLFYRYAPETCLEINVKASSFPQVQGLAETPWAKEISERHEAWDRDLPDDEQELWDFLFKLDEASRRALFAHCVSLSLNAVVERWNRRPRALAHADTLAGAVGFDMVSAGWSPTVDNYLGKVTKARILEAVRDARGEGPAQLIEHLKKQDMAQEAARLLEGSNWLPEPLRNPAAASTDVEGPADVLTDGDGETAELPAFLAEETAALEHLVEAAE